MLEALIEEIGDFPYSIIIDESTDLSTQKVLRYGALFIAQGKVSCDNFLSNNKDNRMWCKKRTWINRKSTQKRWLKSRKLIGIDVDGANVMVGKHNSVTDILKRELPDLIIVKCVSHSLHLCAERAAELLPRQLEFLVRETHYWF